MKKCVTLFLFSLFLVSCGDQNQYKEAVLADMKQEKDLEDYQISPEKMTECVVDLTSKKMAGLFAFDPIRMKMYRHYTTMLTLPQSENPQATLAQLTKDFGSSKALIEARINYSENIGNCMASLIMKKDEEMPAENIVNTK